MAMSIKQAERKGERIGCTLVGFLFGGISMGTYPVHQSWALVAVCLLFAVLQAWRDEA